MPDPSASDTGKNGDGLNRILVASDLTAYSDRAFDRAVILAEKNHAALRFLHAIEPGVLSESYVQGNIEEAKRDLEYKVQESGIDKRLSVSVAVRRGNTDKVVVDESSTRDRDGKTTVAPEEIERRHQIEDLVTARFAAAGRGGLGSDNGPTVIVEGGKASKVLQKHVAQMAPDLVVLGTHGRTGVSTLFLGSVAATLLDVLSQDVLVARA